VPASGWRYCHVVVPPDGASWWEVTTVAAFACYCEDGKAETGDPLFCGTPLVRWRDAGDVSEGIGDPEWDQGDTSSGFLVDPLWDHERLLSAIHDCEAIIRERLKRQEARRGKAQG
jgi:hypothetical protein